MEKKCFKSPVLDAEMVKEMREKLHEHVDSAWQKARLYGSTNGHNNHWNSYTLAQDPPYTVPEDAVSPSAHWIWTDEADLHDDVYCPYESFHTFKNCKAPPDRYDQDYPWLNDGVVGGTNGVVASAAAPRLRVLQVGGVVAAFAGALVLGRGH